MLPLADLPLSTVLYLYGYGYPTAPELFDVTKRGHARSTVLPDARCALLI